VITFAVHDDIENRARRYRNFSLTPTRLAWIF
jgi:hypothetical protein